MNSPKQKSHQSGIPDGNRAVHRRTVLHAALTGIGWASCAAGIRPVQGMDSVHHESLVDSVLFINLAGGPSQLETFDPKPDGPVETRGDFQTIQTSIPGVRVGEHLGKFAQLADQFTLIRGISHTTGDHPQGQAYISTGNRPSPVIRYPSLGSVAQRERPSADGLPSFIAIPRTEWNAGYLGDALAPFKTNAVPQPGKRFEVRGLTPPAGVTSGKLDRRQRLLDQLDQRYAGPDSVDPLWKAFAEFGSRANRMMRSARTQSAFDVEQEPASIRGLFGADELGQSLLLATRLVRFGCRFITVTNPGWDTHLDNFSGHRRLIPPLDEGLFAVVSALKMQGLLERTLVVVMGEFGRTPKINANAGRDHYPQVNCCLMIGGGIRGGQVIGGTNFSGERPDDRTRISPDDLAATILDSLGIDPRREYLTTTGRPVTLIPNGRQLPGLFAAND